MSQQQQQDRPVFGVVLGDQTIIHTTTDKDRALQLADQWADNYDQEVTARQLNRDSG